MNRGQRPPGAIYNELRGLPFTADDFEERAVTLLAELEASVKSLRQEFELRIQKRTSDKARSS